MILKNEQMKYFLIIVGLVLLVSCKSYEIVQYEYRSTTMMGTRTVTITKDSVVSNYSGRMESNRIVRTTSPEEWAEFVWGVINSQGQRIAKEGKALETEAENRAELLSQATEFSHRHPGVMRTLGIAN